MKKTLISIFIGCTLGLTLRYFGVPYYAIAGLSASKDAIIILAHKEQHFSIKGVASCLIYSTFTAFGLGLIPLIYRSVKKAKK